MQKKFALLRSKLLYYRKLGSWSGEDQAVQLSEEGLEKLAR